MEIRGRATHSSAPDLGENPILLVGEVQARLERMPLDETRHDRLGVRSLVPYKLVCGPVAPHTIPSSCLLVLDRRLLPGDEPETVVAEIADELADLPVTVRQGATMLPALVKESDTVVVALQRGAELALGRPLGTFYPPYLRRGLPVLDRRSDRHVRTVDERDRGHRRARRGFRTSRTSPRSRRRLRGSDRGSSALTRNDEGRLVPPFASLVKRSSETSCVRSRSPETVSALSSSSIEILSSGMPGTSNP